MAGTTWNPADLSGVTLSGGNLTATANTSGAPWVRAIDKKTTGKFYWEFTRVTWNSSNTGHGFCPSTLSSPNGALATGMCAVYPSGVIYVNGSNTGSALGTIGGGIVGIALDLGANLAWLRIAPSGNWNGSGTANPATAAGGISVSSVTSPDACPLAAFGQNLDGITTNFGDSAFSGAVPAGFTAGWPGAAVAGTTQARAMVLA